MKKFTQDLMEGSVEMEDLSNPNIFMKRGESLYQTLYPEQYKGEVPKERWLPFEYTSNTNGYRMMEGSTTVMQVASTDNPGVVISTKTISELFSDNVYVSIFQHIDLDGDASAAITYRMCCGPEEQNSNVHFCKYNYNDKFIIDHIDKMNRELAAAPMDKKRIAFIVDLSLPSKDPLNCMQAILKAYDRVIWIDHHVTSIQTMNEIKQYIPSNLEFNFYIDTRVSAAYSCWVIMFPIMAKLNDKVKKSFDKGDKSVIPSLVSIYDTRDIDKHPKAYELSKYLNQYYFDMNGMGAKSDMWIRLLFGNTAAINSVLKSGQKLVKINTIKNKHMFRSECVYKAKYKDFEVQGMNTHFGNSSRFIPSEEDRKYKTVLLIKIKDYDDSVTISGYTDSDIVKSINLGVLFHKLFNGGGHPGAAGFTLPINDFNKSINDIYDKWGLESVSNGIEWDIDEYHVRYNEKARMIFESLSSVIIHELLTIK
jgi:oligoribonuclease NrnB/cAMP/cGMP phosphodiesterase (DHH superfamily)